MTCLGDDLVLGLVEGRLGAPALAAIDEHLDTCASCRDVVAQVARVQAPAHVLERGHTVGRYVIGELLGTGAMGRVYSAWEPELDRRVAIKLLVDGERARIVREAQAMARLDHPNIVGVHEVGSAPEGVYVVMELVDGETLRTWTATPRPWREVVTVLIEIARGLAAVHAAGVVHRDVKPDNVIIGKDRRARLGDFGLARAGASVGEAPADDASLAIGTPLTAVAGTPAYMAPEVLRGRAADEASDQFSFGVTAYEALCGRRPFEGRTWAQLAAAIDAGTIAPLRGVPGWLDAAIRRCLAGDRDRRFRSMGMLADHLAQRSHRRSPARWIAAAALAAGVASTLTWVALRRPAVAAACELDELGAAWTPGVRDHLATIGAPGVAALDRWTAAWTLEREAACAATTAEMPGAVRARAACLAQRRDDLAALVEHLARSPAAFSGRVADALATLPAPTECRAALPGAADPLPLDPTKRVAIADVARALAPIRVAVALGDARTVVAAAAAQVARARAIGHAPTLADTLIVDAEAQRAAGQLAEAALAARDALAAAERGHDDAAAARAWITRVALAGDRRELASAEDFGAIAAAAVDRAGASPRLIATVARLRGLIAYNRGALADARALLIDARARYAAASGDHSLDVADTESALGSVARAAGDLDAAERHHRAALALDRELRGPDHALVGRDLHNVAGVLRLRGDLAAAFATYTEALVLEDRTRGEHSIESALTHNSLGLVAMARGEWTTAREHLTIARVVLTAAGHGDRAFAEHNLGLVAAATGDHHLAVEQFTRAAEVYTATIGDTAPAAIRLVLDRAISEAALGDAQAAVVHARRAIALARTAHLDWIVDEATKLAATPAAAKSSPRPLAVDVAVEAPPRDAPPRSPAPLAIPQPAVIAPQVPAAPKRDVGVYGASQTW